MNNRSSVLKKKLAAVLQQAQGSPVQEKVKDKALHGMEGRLLRSPVPGTGVVSPQGPRAYGPRISKV